MSQIAKIADAVMVAAEAIEKNYTTAIILAAGSSSRMAPGQNKQFTVVNGKPVLAHTLLAYQNCPLVREIIVVTKEDDFDAVRNIREQYVITKLKKLVTGSSSRQASAKNGFENISAQTRFVAIADGARCLTTSEQISKVCLAAYRHNAASAAHLVNDTLKRATILGTVTATVDRTNLWQVQTPQVFQASLYAAALSKAKRDGLEVTDDNALIENLGYKVYLTECGASNFKVTTVEDLPMAEAILRYRGSTDAC